MNENSIKNLIAGLFVIFMVFVMIFLAFLFSGGFNKTETTTYITNFNTISGLNPGADVSASPSCKIDEIGLSGTYDGFEKFNFQHILFLLDASLDANTST